MTKITEDQFFSILQATALFHELKERFEAIRNFSAAHKVVQLMDDAGYDLAVMDKKPTAQPIDYSPVTASRLYRLRDLAISSRDLLQTDSKNLANILCQFIDNLELVDQPLFSVEEYVGEDGFSPDGP